MTEMTITDLDRFCRKPLIVFHSADADGIYSAWVCDYYYHNSYIPRKCNAELDYMPWNYGDSIDFADMGKLRDASVVFMADVTLPDEYMNEFADKIVWLDHHMSAIERSIKNEWGKRLLYNGSKIGTAGCKLSWNYFYEDEREVPYFIEYASLYDIWNKENPEVDYFDCYNREHLAFGTADLKRKSFEALKSNFAFINSEVVGNRLSVIFEGKKLYLEKEKENERQCKVMAHYGEILGHRVAIANFDKCNSEWFKWIVKKHPDIEYLLTFDYVFAKKAWRVSAYNSSTNLEGDALSLLYRIVAGEAEDVVSIGGHKGACGMVCRNLERILLSKVS